MVETALAGTGKNLSGFSTNRKLTVRATHWQYSFRMKGFVFRILSRLRWLHNSEYEDCEGEGACAK